MSSNNQNTFSNKINKISFTALLISQISTSLLLKFGSWYFDLPLLSTINNMIITIYILMDINICLFKYSLSISQRLFDYFDNLELFRIEEDEAVDETYKKMFMSTISKEDDEKDNYQLDRELTDDYRKAIDNLMIVSQRTNLEEN